MKNVLGKFNKESALLFGISILGIFSISFFALQNFPSFITDNATTDNLPLQQSTVVTTSDVPVYTSTITPSNNTVSITPTQINYTTSVVTQNPLVTSVVATSTASPTLTFSPTPTPEALSAYVAFYSDPQSDTDAEDTNHQRVVNYILARGANPVFNGGDIMEDGTEDSLNRFNNVTATLRSSRIFYSALGNNDRDPLNTSQPSPLYLSNFSFPNNERWYSVNIGNLHMVVLDSAFASGSASQLSWLASDLQSAASQNRITGVIFHHPTFASTISSYLVNYNVDFVLMGHVHSYQHYTTNGVHYFTTTGQPYIGYFIIRAYSSYATLTAYNSGNGTIETVTINQR